MITEIKRIYFETTKDGHRLLVAVTINNERVYLYIGNEFGCVYPAWLTKEEADKGIEEYEKSKKKKKSLWRTLFGC